ncbi:MAG: TonB-dependent receptor [Desulfobacterales bacterium]|nr:TonB-dependent receptor [Desulfobacterales bacterium]
MKGLKTIPCLFGLIFVFVSMAQAQETVELEKMVVTAPERTGGLREASALTTVIPKEQIEAANLDTIADVLRLAPNVWQPRSYSPKIHGNTALVLIDGQRVTTGGCPGRGRVAELDGFVSADQIERIEIITGGQAVLYGQDAMGGVINIITKSPTKKPTFSASSSFASLDTEIYNVSHAYKPGKFGYRLGYTHRETDGFNEETDKRRDDELWTTLTYNFSPTNKLTLTPKFFENTQLPEGKDKSVRRRRMVSGSWDYKIDDVSALYVTGGHTNRISGGSHTETIEAKVAYNRLLFGSNLVTLSYQYEEDEAWGGEKFDWNSYVIHDEISFDPFIFTLGLRVDDHCRYDKYYSPSAGVVYKATDDLTLRGSVGKGIWYNLYGAAYYDEWDYNARSGEWRHVPPGLDPECLTSYEIGGEYRILENLLATVSLFRNDVEDEVEWVDIGTITREGITAPARERKNIGESVTQGVDVAISSDITKNIFASLGYSFLDTEIEDTGKEFTKRPRHKLNLILNWNIPDYGLSGFWGTQYVGKKWRDSANTVELPDYWVTNVNIAKHITKYGKIIFSVDNLFDADYEDKTTGKYARDYGSYELPERAYKVEVKIFF